MTFTDYKSIKALVIDDFPSMRSAFKMALASFSMNKVDMAADSSEAMMRVKGCKYDVIISDYNLGDGRDGQQLLEELRHNNLIGLETAFLIVTAESVYERVVAAAELAPDDYLIKPFNGEILRTRLDAILLKKAAFRKAHRAFARQELEAVLLECDAIMKAHPKYVVDALRFKGETLIAMGDFEAAEALYRQIVAMRAVPWSRLGLAKSLHLQRKDAHAEDFLRDILDQHPELVAGYDLMADVQLAQNKFKEAQSTLHRGVGISARSPRRQRRLGELAYQNNDLRSAEVAFRTAIEKSKFSIHVTPNDFANLSRIQLEQNNPKAALDLLNEHRKLLSTSDEGKLVNSIIQGKIAAHAGQTAQASAFLQEAMRIKQMSSKVDPMLELDMVEGCIKAGLHTEADELLTSLARNAHDSVALLDKAKRIYEEAGQAERVAQILQQATAKVAALSKEGILLLQRGDLEQGVKRLMQAAKEAPRNPRVLMNTAWSIMRLVEQQNEHAKMLIDAKRMLDDAAHLQPDHPRLAGLQTSMRNTEAKIAAKRMQELYGNNQQPIQSGFPT